MKALVIYYSYEGNTRFIAKVISKQLKSDLLELKPEQPLLNTHGFTKYIWGGKQVLMKEKPELKKLSKDPEDYDLILIGTPVWAWNYTPPIRTLLSKNLINNKKVALFCTYDNNPGSSLDNMNDELSEHNVVIEEQGFQKPLQDKVKSKIKAINWVSSIA